MATRRIYIALSRRFGEHHDLLRHLLFGVMVGGFVMLAIASQVLPRPGLLVSIGARLWFSATCALGVLWLATAWFNPQRDYRAGSLQESGAAFLLNAMLIAAIAGWFME
jgi:hypothetical protein